MKAPDSGPYAGGVYKLKVEFEVRGGTNVAGGAVLCCSVIFELCVTSLYSLVSVGIVPVQVP